MTTYVDFTPSATAPFQFQATLDGSIYNVIITWSLFGQRYYVNVYDLNGNNILSLPMIGSPLNYDISITAGYFSTMLVWRVENNQFEII